VAAQGWRDRARDAVRPALAGLTTRGRSFISAGVASAVCAVLLGQEDLLRVAVLLVALPIVCTVMLSRAHYRISLTRTLHPDRVEAGQTIRVRLEMQNLARLSTRVLLAEDRVPYALGAAPRFVLDRLPGTQQAAVTYSLRSQVRGRYLIGPLHIKVADPFGMCELTRAFTSTQPVTVTPVIWPLSSVGSGGSWGRSGESLSRSASVSGEDDSSTREYREGDDLRRVHWRSTAKRGELMVRREEQPRQLRVCVLLDARQDGHRGEGAASSFEWAVSAAASVAAHYSSLQHGVSVMTSGEPVAWTRPSSGDDVVRLMDQLAVLRPGPPPILDDAIAQLRRSRPDALIVAVLGELTTDQALRLAALGRDGFPGVAILLRTQEWSSVTGRRVPSAAAAPSVAGVLRQGNWLVTEAGYGQTPAQAWAGFTTPAPEPHLSSI
jgi:uncharacterized protein (DUF58 family)